MNRLDIMLDIETLGLTPANPIIQLSAVAFNLHDKDMKIETFDEFSYPDAGAVVSESTVQWWLDTNKQLFTEILAKGKTANLTEKQLVENFIIWVKALSYTYGIKHKEIYLWGNGILFDNMFIKSKCTTYNLEYPIFYRNDRDVRTVIDIYCAKFNVSREDLDIQFKSNAYIHHNGLHDCMYQIEMLRTCYLALL